MRGGFVLDFSNRTFEEFFREVVGVQIYETRFDRGSGSKANRMRAFWDVATKEQLQLFFNGLLEGWPVCSLTPMPSSANTLIQQILKRMEYGFAKTESQQSNQRGVSISEAAAKKLIIQLIELTILLPQQRGYEFEKFLKGMFDAYGLSARASFRLTGEQIDGSFVLHDETYLLEAKWQNSPTRAEDLHVFEGKLQQKASWSRGLFVSISGFTEDGLVAFGKGKRLICMDGGDLAEMLQRKLSAVDVLAAKVRKAAETGNPFVRVRELSM
jgi:Restriction endonuclease